MWLKRFTRRWASVGLAFALLISSPSAAVAVQFGAGTGSGYPAAIDTTNPRTNAPGYDPCSSATTTNACAEFINDLQDAAAKLETAVGANPKGTSASVAEKILGLRSYSGATADTINIVGNQVGIGTATPATSALFDFFSTTAAVLFPRMTTTQKNALTATDGMLIYDTTLAQYQFRQNGAWVGSAPTDAGYWVDTANGTLSAERNLGGLTTGLVLNTVTTGVGVPSAYGGASCTNQFPRSLSASGAATCATVGSADLASGLSLASPVATAKIGLPRVASLPGSPSAGDTVIITDDSAVGACDSAAGSAQSLCQYNGTGWVSLGDGTGGSTITIGSATVATSQGTTSSTYTDLATAGPSVTLTPGPSGNALIFITARMQVTGGGTIPYVGVVVSGGNTVAAADASSLNGPQVADVGMRATAVVRLSGLAAASSTFKLQYHSNGTLTANFQDRDIIVKTW